MVPESNRQRTRINIRGDKRLIGHNRALAAANEELRYPLPSAPSFGKNPPCNLVARQKPGQRLATIEAVVRLRRLSGTKGNERLCGGLWTQYVCDEPHNDCERAEHENNPTCPRKSGHVAYSCAITPAIAQAAAMCSKGNESPPCQVFSIGGAHHNSRPCINSSAGFVWPAHCVRPASTLVLVRRL